MGKTYYFDFLLIRGYELLIVVSEQGLCFIDFVEPTTKWTKFNKWAKVSKQLINLEHSAKKTAVYKDALIKYFHHQRQLGDVALDLQGTAFQINVWTNLLKINNGELITYETLSQLMHMPRATRAIANAVAKNPVLLFVPCHRVVSKNGAIKYRSGPNIKKMLITLENNF